MEHSAAEQFLNVFQPEEIQVLLDRLNKLPQAQNTGKMHAYTNGFKKTDLIYPFIKKKVLTKLEQLLDRKITLVHGMLLNEKLPWRIHTDYIKNDKNPDLAIIIPLNATPINTHTVVFNEVCKDNFLKNNLTEKIALVLFLHADEHSTLDD